MLKSLWVFRSLSPLALVIASTALSALPTRAAEEVLLDLGSVNRSVTVSSLNEFLENGTTAGVLQYLDQEQQDSLRLALTESQEFDIVQLSRWLNSPMGERTLLFAGQLFQTRARLNGQKAIRAAIIASLADDGELTLLELIENFPSQRLVVDISQTIAYARQTIENVNVTLTVIDAVSQQSTADAEQGPPVDLEALPDLTDVGPYSVERVELALEDASRQRSFPADLFLPANLDAFQEPIPVAVMSHGFGDTRTSFYEQAAHVATHGIAVVLLEHIGSNQAQKEAMRAGLSNEAFSAREFLDRPLDVSFVLDELAQANQTEYQGKLELDRVVMLGHSFGGYTALAIAGATIDFEELERRCAPDANILVNTAMLLECRALELTEDQNAVERLGEAGVRDERVAAAMGFTPVTKLFGESGLRRIEVPVALMAGAFDVITPIVPQQVLAFNWLQTPDKYLFLGEQGSHSRSSTGFTRIVLNLADDYDQNIQETFPNIDFTTLDLDLSREFDQELEDALDLVEGVNLSVIIAFTQVHVAGDSTFEPYLAAPYIEAVSEDPFNFNVVRELPERAIRVLGLP
ncbi:MAG: alpha/beta hydrolase [Synechococcus sp.]